MMRFVDGGSHEVETFSAGRMAYVSICNFLAGEFAVLTTEQLSPSIFSQECKNLTTKWKTERQHSDAYFFDCKR